MGHVMHGSLVLAKFFPRYLLKYALSLPPSPLLAHCLPGNVSSHPVLNAVFPNSQQPPTWGRNNEAIYWVTGFITVLHKRRDE